MSLKKIAICFILLLLITFNIVSTESFEFSIGAGIYTSSMLSLPDTNNSGAEFGIPIPVSFVYFPNKNFGIGVNYKLLPKVCLVQSLDLSNHISLVHKIGSNIDGKFLLIEYGFISSGKLMISGGNFYDTLFGIGANCISIGFEKRSQSNKFLFTFDGFVNFIAFTYKDITQVDFYILNIGVEFRWRFCHYIEY